MSDVFINIPNSGSPTWRSPVDDAADLPLNGNHDGDARVTLDTDSIWVWDQNTTSWKLAATPAGAVAIDALLGDVSATGPGAVPATVNFVGGASAADIAQSVLDTQAATSTNTPNTIVKRNGSGNFAAGTITASLTGNVTGNVSGSSASFTGVLAGDVTGTQGATSISSPTVTGKLLTGLVPGSNTPILATDSILIGFEKLQAQSSASSGSAITALTGDATATGPGSVPITLATVNGNVGSFGSSTSIPSFTVNGKGLITAASGNVVIAPAGTLTGTTLASNVVNSSLTSVGTLTSLTVSGTISASNLSGTNTGDVTLAAFGSSPNANGASLSGQVLTLQPADSTHSGGVTTTTQTFSGNKSFLGNTNSINLTINGTGGNGFLQLNSQSGTPTTPIGGFIFFSDVTNRMTQLNTSGFTTTYDSNGITANRVYTLRDVSGKFLLDSRISYAATSISTSPVTILNTDAFAMYNVDTSAARTINLPTATSVADRAYIFKDVTGTSETNNISIVPNGTDQIEGLNTTKIFQTNFGSWILISDGVSKWWMM